MARWTLVNHVESRELENPVPKKGPGSESSVAGSTSTGDAQSSVALPPTLAAKEHVEEDPKLNITFQFLEKPKANATVNAAPEIRST
jgi:hypothetical protein